ARTSIAQALVAMNPDSRAAALAVALADPLIHDELRPKIGLAIAQRGDRPFVESLREVMQRAPMRLQTTMAETLAGDAAGADALLTLTESGHAAPRLLLQPNVGTKLGTLKNADLDRRAAELTARLPAPSAIIDALVTDRRRGFVKAATNIERGQA